MNKVILSLLLAVCVLGMALIMLNERLGNKSDSASSAPGMAMSPATPENTAPLPPLEPATPGEGATLAPAAPRDPAAQGTAPTMQTPQAIQAQGSGPAQAAAQATAQPARPQAGDSASGANIGASSNGALASHTAPATTRPASTVEEAKSAPKEARTEKAQEKAPEKPQAKAPAPSSAPQKLSIERFVVFARDKGATVRLVGASPLSYKTMNLTGPDRLVLDLDGDWQIKAPGVPKNPAVTNVRLGKTGTSTRVVIDLKTRADRARLVLSQDKKTLDVRVDE